MVYFVIEVTSGKRLVLEEIDILAMISVKAAATATPCSLHGAWWKSHSSPSNPQLAAGLKTPSRLKLPSGHAKSHNGLDLREWQVSDTTFSAGA